MAAWKSLNPKQWVGYLNTGMDPDEAAIAPEKRHRLLTPDVVRDSRSLLEHERVD